MEHHMIGGIDAANSIVRRLSMDIAFLIPSTGALKIARSGLLLQLRKSSPSPIRLVAPAVLTDFAATFRSPALGEPRALGIQSMWATARAPVLQEPETGRSVVDYAWAV
jgi:hypothetical protein